MNHTDYINQAISLGALSMRVFRIEKYVAGVGRSWVNFSYHFFNAHDTEVCYYIEDLKDVVPMFIFAEPRVWSEEFKNNPAYALINL